MANITLTKEKIEWRQLCKWVEINLFDYDSMEQRLQTDALLILKGLHNNQYVANNKIAKTKNYPSNVVLMAFQINKNLILKSIKNKYFSLESDKMRYICSIVKKDLDDVYNRYLKTLEVNHDRQD